ncbi:hypothetical protein GCM10027060_20110 [Nesterenkonia halophila]
MRKVVADSPIIVSCSGAWAARTSRSSREGPGTDPDGDAASPSLEASAGALLLGAQQGLAD